MRASTLPKTFRRVPRNTLIFLFGLINLSVSVCSEYSNCFVGELTLLYSQISEVQYLLHLEPYHQDRRVFHSLIRTRLGPYIQDQSHCRHLDVPTS